MKEKKNLKMVEIERKIRSITDEIVAVQMDIANTEFADSLKDGIIVLRLLTKEQQHKLAQIAGGMYAESKESMRRRVRELIADANAASLRLDEERAALKTELEAKKRKKNKGEK